MRSLRREASKLLRKLFQKHARYVAQHPADFAESQNFFTRDSFWKLYKVIRVIFLSQHGSLTESIRRALTLEERMRPHSLSGFVQKRDKVKLCAFIYIFINIILDIEKMFPPKLYKGMYVIACDGSDFPMPSEVVPSEAGASKARKVQHCMDHVNAFYDVRNMLYIAVTIRPKLQCSERSELLYMAKALPEQNPNYKPEKCIILCDRGYESYHVLRELNYLGYHFIIRCPAQSAKGLACLKELPVPEGSDPIEIISTIKLRRGTDGVYDKSNTKNWRDETDEKLTVRIVIAKLAEGKVEYLVTNLPKAITSAKEAVKLYGERWEIETGYRYVKYSVGGIVLHSKKLKAQEMEIYASLALYNCISAIITHIEVDNTGCKYKYKLNFNECAAECIDYLFTDKVPPGSLETVLASYKVQIKPGRNFKRGHLVKKVKGFNYRT